MTLKELFTSIADTIRNQNPHQNEKIKALDFPSEIENACAESHYSGYSLGEIEGIAKGRQKQYDEFWDRYQDYGKRTQYYAAFCCVGYDAWDFDNFKPKYDIKSINAQYMFWNFGSTKNVPLNLKQHLSDIGIEMDFSQCKGMYQVFIGSRFTHIPYLNCSQSQEIYQTFQNSPYLETIDGIYLTKSAVFVDPFKDCSKLANITFEGEIGNSIDFHWSPLLTVESLRSILTTLSKSSSTANGKTLTLNTASKAVIEADSECSTQLASAVAAGWTVAYNS